MVGAIILIVSLGIAMLWGFVKIVNAVFNPLIRKVNERTKDIKDPHRHNPYVLYHRARHNNDKMYDEYIEWMDKNDHGLPVEKVKFPEEEKFEKELHNDHKRYRK